MGNSILNEKAKCLAAHSAKNTIDLDKSSDDESSSCEDKDEPDTPETARKL